MQDLLTEFNPFDPTSSAARYRAVAELRRRSPIHKLRTGQWLVLSQAGVAKGLASVDHFVGSFGDTGDRGRIKR